MNQKPRPCFEVPSATKSNPANSLGRTAVKTLAMVQSIIAVGSLQAQEANYPSSSEYKSKTKLPEVIVEEQQNPTVSSPKFTEPVRDTPQTVVIVPREVYTQQNATTLSDVLRNTPGITFAAGEGGSASSTAGDSFYMRGFDTSNNIFVDGVRDVGAYSRDVFNLEQVEIAKGPAGSDVGRGAASGYVNLDTKTPQSENFTKGTLSYGFDEKTSSDQRRVALDVNQTVKNDTVKGLAFRLNGMWQDSGIVGRDYAENKSWGFAPSLALGLGTNTRATLSYQHVKQDNLPDYGLPTPAFPGYVSTPPPTPVNRKTFYGFLTDYDRVTSNAYTLRLEHDFSPTLRVSNQTRYSQNQRDAVVTTPGSSATAYAPDTGLLTRSRQGNKRDTDILSNQTNVTAELTTGPIKHNLSGGVEFSRETAYSPAFTSATLKPILLASPDPTATPDGSPVRSGASTDVKTDTSAVYGFDTLKFSDQWQATAGLRWEHYKTDYYSVPAAGAGSPARVDASDNILSWKTGLVFKPVPSGSIYAAAGISLTPPGTDFTLSSAAGNQNNPDTAPQRTTSYEVGTKWDFLKDRLSLTASVFQTQNDKTVFTDPVLGPVPTGKQTVKGVEIGISGKITENLLAFGGYSHLDTEINSGTTTGNNPAGAELPLTPTNSGNLWTTYKLPVGLTIGGGARYVSATNRRDATTAAPRTMPSYWLFNGVASYEVNKHLTLRANVNNVFDKEYVQSYNNNGGRFVPGAPRAYTLSAELSF